MPWPTKAARKQGAKEQAHKESRGRPQQVLSWKGNEEEEERDFLSNNEEWRLCQETRFLAFLTRTISPYYASVSLLLT